MAFWLERLDETFALVGPGADRKVSDYYRQQIWVSPSGMFNQYQLDSVVAAWAPIGSSTPKTSHHGLLFI